MLSDKAAVVKMFGASIKVSGAFITFWSHQLINMGFIIPGACWVCWVTVHNNTNFRKLFESLSFFNGGICTFRCYLALR